MLFAHRLRRSFAEYGEVLEVPKDAQGNSKHYASVIFASRSSVLGLLQAGRSYVDGMLVEASPNCVELQHLLKTERFVLKAIESSNVIDSDQGSSQP